MGGEEVRMLSEGTGPLSEEFTTAKHDKMPS